MVEPIFELDISKDTSDGSININYKRKIIIELDINRENKIFTIKDDNFKILNQFLNKYNKLKSLLFKENEFINYEDLFNKIDNIMGDFLINTEIPIKLFLSILNKDISSKRTKNYNFLKKSIEKIISLYDYLDFENLKLSNIILVYIYFYKLKQYKVSFENEENDKHKKYYEFNKKYNLNQLFKNLLITNSSIKYEIFNSDNISKIKTHIQKLNDSNTFNENNFNTDLLNLIITVKYKNTKLLNKIFLVKYILLILINEINMLCSNNLIKTKFNIRNNENNRYIELLNFYNLYLYISSIKITSMYLRINKKLNYTLTNSDELNFIFYQNTSIIYDHLSSNNINDFNDLYIKKINENIFNNKYKNYFDYQKDLDIDEYESNLHNLNIPKLHLNTIVEKSLSKIIGINDLDLYKQLKNIENDYICFNNYNLKSLTSDKKDLIIMLSKYDSNYNKSKYDIDKVDNLVNNIFNINLLPTFINLVYDNNKCNLNLFNFSPKSFDIRKNDYKLDNQLIKCINKRYIYIIFKERSFIVSKLNKSGHTVNIIIDTLKKTVNFFDPMAQLSLYNGFSINLYIIRKLLSNINPTNIDIYNLAQDILNNYEFKSLNFRFEKTIQDIEADNPKFTDRTYFLEQQYDWMIGYCSLWSIYLAVMLMINKDYDIDLIIYFFIKISSRKNKGYIKLLIRSFAYIFEKSLFTDTILEYEKYNLELIKNINQKYEAKTLEYKELKDELSLLDLQLQEIETRIQDANKYNIPELQKLHKTKLELKTKLYPKYIQNSTNKYLGNPSYFKNKTKAVSRLFSMSRKILFSSSKLIIPETNSIVAHQNSNHYNNSNHSNHLNNPKKSSRTTSKTKTIRKSSGTRTSGTRTSRTRTSRTRTSGTKSSKKQNS